VRFTFTVEVEVERIEGKFASRDDIGQQILDELEGCNPGQFTSENDGEYEVVDWSVEEQEQPKRKRR
jgi:hypothetical protein